MANSDVDQSSKKNQIPEKQPIYTRWIFALATSSQSQNQTSDTGSVVFQTETLPALSMASYHRVLETFGRAVNDDDIQCDWY
jgi:hypothetical protein